MLANRSLRIENLERREVFSVNPLAAPVDSALAAGVLGEFTSGHVAEDTPVAPDDGSLNASRVLLSAEIVLIGTHHGPAEGPAGQSPHHQRRINSLLDTMVEGDSCGV